MPKRKHGEALVAPPPRPLAAPRPPSLESEDLEPPPTPLEMALTEAIPEATDGDALPVEQQAVLAVDIWKRYACQEWIAVPTDWHTCGQADGGCRLDSLPLRLYRLDDESSAVAALFPLALAQFADAKPALWHACLPGVCPLEASHGCHAGQGVTRLRESASLKSDLYVCRSTALWHLCGSHCKLRTGFNADSSSVCPLTGRLGTSGVTGAPEARAVSAFWAPHVGNSTKFSSVSGRLSNPWSERYESRHARTLRDNRGVDSRALDGVASAEATPEEPYKKHRAALLRSDNMQRAVNSGRLSEHEGLTTKARVLQQLEDKLRNLFSDTRMRAELQCNREIDAEIRVHLGRYANRKGVQGELIQVQDMELLAEDCRVKHTTFPVVQLSAQARQEICKYLAVDCLKLWVLIVTRTRQGRDAPQEFELRDFLEPALQLFQEGVYVSRAEMDEDVQIIKPRRVLLEIPVNTPTASCFLRAGRVDEEMTREAGKNSGSKTTNELKKRIHAAILEEVVERGTAPALLRPESIHFDAIDDRLFELVHQAKRCAAGVSRGTAAHRAIVRRLEALDLTGATGALSGETPAAIDPTHVRHAAQPRRPLPREEARRLRDEGIMRHWKSVGPPEWFLFRYQYEGAGVPGGEDETRHSTITHASRTSARQIDVFSRPT